MEGAEGGGWIGCNANGAAGLSRTDGSRAGLAALSRFSAAGWICRVHSAGALSSCDRVTWWALRWPAV